MKHLISAGDSSVAGGRLLFEERIWGWYKVTDYVEFPNGQKVLTKLICIHNGKNISYQRHHHRHEVWTVVDGCGTLVLDGVVSEVAPGSVVQIAKEQMHTIRAKGTDLYFVEVQLGDLLQEDDIDRFPYSWE
ncbi:MAG: phosphomannose isomerase type II C-terminal cupin domain [Bacteroidales bacterium]|nr:phosphomannose isomerase type II C-terminal cupin domain [Bacteroidales bacterium]